MKGGRKLKYEEMKKALLHYYRKKKIGGKAYWKKKLDSATPLVGEDYEIFGMRLTEMAELSYPGHKKECARRLRKKFLSGLPLPVSSKIADAERALKVTSRGKRKYLPFSELLQLATDLQRDQDKKQVMFSQQQDSFSSHNRESSTARNFRGSEPSRGFRESEPSRGFRDSVPSKGFRDSVPSRGSRESGPPRNFREFRPQRSSSAGPLKNHSPSVDPVGGGIGCSYCGRPNHRRSDCWRASGRCLICGCDHAMRDCPKFDPQFGMHSQAHNTLQPALND